MCRFWYVADVGAPQYVDQPQHEWPQWANEVITRLGEAGEATARFAAAHASDAVVLARRSRLEPGRASVLRAILDQTPCPVLLVGD